VRSSVLTALVLAFTVGLGHQSPAKATTWDQIGGYLRLIQSAGIEAMVANDCPLGLFGAYHAGRDVLLMCGNNIPDDPAVVWEVLAHESAHVMQVCKGGDLMPESLLAEEMEATIDKGADTFHELALYRSGRHHVEAEARVVQALPPQQVEALFIKHCGDRLDP
tara:strand:+ start:1718 stop:2209 length:492 start_codon:yes stop_codon:yes gene_type:complete